MGYFSGKPIAKKNIPPPNIYTDLFSNLEIKTNISFPVLRKQIAIDTYLALSLSSALFVKDSRGPHHQLKERTVPKSTKRNNYVQ